MYHFVKFAALAAVLCATRAFGQGAIEGVITNPEGEALDGAHVILNPGMRGTYTRPTGTFSFKNLAPATYTIKVTYLGYKDFSKEVTVSDKTINQKIEMAPSPFMSDEVVVSATRLSPKAPATFQNIEKREIQELNLGQDLPYLLDRTPSLVTTSDAGAGVGYTSMRIRGSDQTRINVTVNGIPINDSESQGVFWVNMPDLATSLSSLQIQRGLGTSTNGSGAFGASINMETKEPFAGAGGAISSSYGSYNTHKNSISFHSGRLDNGFAINGRLSAIGSDGYIDRAKSNLKSYFLSAGYFGKKTIIKAITFSGKQRTYQSWYGTPESRLENDVDGMLAHASREGYSEAQTENLLTSGRTYNYYQYENQVDDYYQTHYQLHFIRQLNSDLKLSLAGHYTTGEGFFEEYKYGDSFADYGKPEPIIGNDTISESDIIRRRWLDNDFYGGTFALDYSQNGHHLTLGGGAHIYRGHHFGEIVWADVSTTVDHLEEYYRNIGDKDDISLYGKWEYSLEKWSFMADLQLRSIDYKTKGIDNDQVPIDVQKSYLFFNPKAGVRYEVDSQNSYYLYLGRGSREPVRNDFIDAPQGKIPEPEILNNIELGYDFTGDKLTAKINGYYMGYQNQLVLTGELNDVGSAVRQNVDKSYRAGVEINGTYMFFDNFGLNANATFSRNKIQSFEEVIAPETIPHSDTDISFSPSVIAGGQLIWRPIEGLEANFITKYVGEQYLDNTQNENRAIDAYWVSNVRLGYTLKDVVFNEIEFNLLVNNVFDAMYASNGYTYSYNYNGLVTENFYYPQAGRNFLVGLNLKF